LTISFDEAETLKVSQGFKPGTNVFPIIEAEAMKIVEEMKEAVSFYGKDFKREVKKILLAGGSTLLPEIEKFFQKFFEIEVKIGDPLTKVKEIENLDRARGVLYSNVIGLALRGISDNPVKSSINLLPTEIKTKEIKTQQGKRKSVLIASAVVALSGLVLLALTIFYLIYLPVPPPMQPLKYRMMTNFPTGEVKEIAILEEFINQEINVYETPGDETKIVFTVTSQDSLEMLQKIDSWYKIKVGEKQGWLHQRYIEGSQEEILPETEETVPETEEVVPETEETNNIIE
jgi:cell division ATPase FtsA